MTTGNNMLADAPVDQQFDWTYMGERIDSKDRTSYAWLDHTGKERWFAKSLAQSPSVGAVYRMTTGTNGSSVYTGGGEKSPVFITHTDDTLQLAKWRAEHEATRTYLAARRAKNSAAALHKGDFGNLTLAEAANWYRTSRTTQSRAGKLATLICYIQTGVLPEND